MAKKKSTTLYAIENKVAIVKKPFPLRRVLLFILILAIGFTALTIYNMFTGSAGNAESAPVGNNTYLSKPVSGTPADVVGDDSIENSAIRNLFIAAGVLKDAGSFSAVCEGATTAHSIIGDVDQKIRSERTVIGSQSFKQSVSLSNFVEIGEQRYTNGSDFLVRDKNKVKTVTDIDWSDNVTALTEEGYLNRYGYIPNEMTSYVLNTDTVLDGRFISYENGLYTFEYDLDCVRDPENPNKETASAALEEEMRYSAGSKNYPEFFYSTLTVTMDDEWVVHTCEVNSQYEVDILGGQTCSEHMVETFYDIGKVEQLPLTDYFSKYFGADAVDDAEKGPDAMLLLAELFEDYINGKPLDAHIDLVAPIAALDGLEADVRLNLDINNLENITAYAQIPLGKENLDVYYGDGAVLLAYGDFKGSLLIEDVIGLVEQFIGGETAGETESETAGEVESETDGSFDLDALLGGATVETTDTDCKISLTIDVADLLGLDADLSVGAEICGKKSAEGKYKFDRLTASIGEYTVTAAASDGYEAKELSIEECPNILGLLDIIKDKIAFTATIGDINADIQIDLSDMSVVAIIKDLSIGGIDIGDITLRYADEVLYAEYRDIRVKLNVNDIESIIEKLSPILELYDISVTETVGAVLGEMSDTEIDPFEILKTINLTADGSVASLSCNVFGADIYLNLQNNDNRWNIANISGAYNDLTFSVTPIDAFDDGEVSGEYIDLGTVVNQYADKIFDLLSADAIKLNVELDLTIEGKAAHLNAEVNLNGGVSVIGTLSYAELTPIDFEIVYIGEKLYLTVGKYNFTIDVSKKESETKADGTIDIQSLLTTLKGRNDSLDAIIDAVVSITNAVTAKDFDYLGLLGGLSFDDEGIKITVNGSQFGISDLDIIIGGDGDLAVTVPEYTIGGITVGMTATLSPSDKAVVAPEREDTKAIKLNVELDLTIDGRAAHLNAEVNLNGGVSVIGTLSYADLTPIDFEIVYIGEKLYLTVGKYNFTIDVSKKEKEATENTTTVSDIQSLLTSLKGRNDSLDAIIDAIIAITNTVTAKDFDYLGLLGGLSFADEGIKITVNGSQFGISDLDVIIGGDGDLAVTVPKYTIGGITIELTATISPSDEAVVAPEREDTKAIKLNVELDLTIDGKAAHLNAEVNLNGGVSASGYLTYQDLKVIKFDIIYKDGILYATVDGVDIAVRIGAEDETDSAETADISAILENAKGYNDSLDAIIDAVATITNAVTAKDFDYLSLFGGLEFDDEGIKITVSGSPFDMENLVVIIGGDGNLIVTVPEYTIGGITVGTSVTLSPSDIAVTVPDREYITYLQIRIDELNVIYAKLDILNGKFSFRMDNLYGEYSDGTIYIAYDNETGSDVLLRCNIDQMTEIITRLQNIVSDVQARYAVELMSELSSDLDATTEESQNTLRDFIRSLKFTTGDDLKVEFAIMGFEGTLTVLPGDDPTFELLVPFLGKDITAGLSEAAKSAEYYDFDSVEADSYVDVADIFHGYMDEIETLVSANSWHFDICAEIMYNGTKLYIAEGSSIDLLYYSDNNFDIKLNLNINTWDEASGAYIDAHHAVLGYVGNRIYVDYWNTSNNSTVGKDNHLKVSISRDAINECTDRISEVLRVVPQLEKLIQTMKDGLRDASEKMELVKYSTIIRKISFNGDELNLVINGGAIISALGDIDITVTKSENGGLDLNIVSITFTEKDAEGNTSTEIAITDFAAHVGALTEEEGIEAIGEWSLDGYMDFDSLNELLAAFTHTADQRSFRIQGKVNAKLLGLVQVDIDIDIAVDIDEEGYVYVTARLYREKPGVIAGIAYDDKGGYSYLNYNGKTDKIRVIRNSLQEHTYCSKCKSYECSSSFWHTVYHNTETLLDTEFGSGAPSYDTGEISSSEFMEHAANHILEMINFEPSIEKKITDSMSKESTTVYGIEDIFTGYTYTDAAEDKHFDLTLDLAPIDGNLGVITVGIHHDESFELTYLNAQMKLLSGICVLTIDRLELQQPTAGEAIQKVTDPTYLYW